MECEGLKLVKPTWIQNPEVDTSHEAGFDIRKKTGDVQAEMGMGFNCSRQDDVTTMGFYSLVVKHVFF